MERLFEIACHILESYGCHIERSEKDTFDFFEIVGKYVSQEKLNAGQTRGKIEDFLERNKRYFQVYLPHTVEWTKIADEDLKEDIKKHRSLPPSPREVFAATEILQREIHVVELKEEKKGKNCPVPFSHAVFAPSIKTKMSAEKETNELTPLIIFRFQDDTRTEKYAEVLGSLFSLKSLFSLSNEEHKHCSIMRYQNTWTNLLCDSISVLPSTVIDFYSIFALVFYGNTKYRDRVKEMICTFESSEENVTMIAGLLKTSDGDNRKEFKEEKIVQEHVRNLRCDNTKPYEPELFALASIFNAPVFVDTTGDGEHWSLYMPLVSCCTVLYDNPVMLQRNKDFKYKIVNTCHGQCLCQQKKPTVKGKIGIGKEHVFEEVMKRIGKETCCPLATRKRVNVFHGHYKHIPYSKTEVSEPVDYVIPVPEIEAIQRERLDTECRRIDQVGGGEGTLQQCLAREIYGNESKTELVEKHLNMQSHEDNLLQYLQRVSDWTMKTVYLLSPVCDAYYSWQSLNPTEPSYNRCRYYITILRKQDGYFDRIIPKCGCNCQLASPMFGIDKDDHFQTDTAKLTTPKEERHMPMVTFIPSDPSVRDFEDEKRQSPIYSSFSELRHVSRRQDMQERYIDTSSRYLYSLYRCISKEIFGTEKHFYSLVQYVVREIRSNPEHYGKLYQQKSKRTIQDFSKSKSTIERENADIFANRIEDGLNLEDLELFAVATFLQSSIYVLVVNDKGISNWIEYTRIRRIRKPVGLQHRQFQSKCQLDSYYMTLYRTSFGQYHRIVPINADCNCMLSSPTQLEVQMESLYIRQDSDAIHFMTRYRQIENCLKAVEVALDKWNRSVITLEIFCEGLIVKLENVRHNVSIATIAGSSVGYIGATFALADVIAARVTFGTFLKLAIAGGVIGLTSVGSMLTEMALNQIPLEQLERKQNVLAEIGEELRTCLTKLKKEATILGPLSALLDVGIGSFAADNVAKGSKTSITSNLRKLSVSLRSMRIQMQIWRYGTKTISDKDEIDEGWNLSLERDALAMTLK